MVVTEHARDSNARTTNGDLDTISGRAETDGDIAKRRNRWYGHEHGTGEGEI